MAALTCGVGQTGANLFNLNWAEFGGGPGVGFNVRGRMKRLVAHDGDFGIALTAAAATAFTAELRGRLQAALSALQATPARPLPPLPPVRVALDGESVLELTTREALDLYFAFMELVDEGASGAAEHIHVYDADDRDEFPVWIDPGSSSRASLAD